MKFIEIHANRWECIEFLMESIQIHANYSTQITEISRNPLKSSESYQYGNPYNGHHHPEAPQLRSTAALFSGSTRPTVCFLRNSSKNVWCLWVAISVNLSRKYIKFIQIARNHSKLLGNPLKSMLTVW